MSPALAWCSATLRPVGPGVALTGVIVLAAAFVSGHYGGPLLLYALLFGMAFHFLADDERCRPGVDFCARVLLRAGVAMLGARITLAQVTDLGIGPAATIGGAVGSTILIGWLLAKRTGRPGAEGVLSGGAVAICGASAALALAAVLPRTQGSERHLLLVVAGVTALSTAAMVLYPLIAGALGLDAREAGIFLGGTIHDVAQVVGAGYMMSDATGDTATVVKLARVMCLLPVALALSVLLGARRGIRPAGTQLVPWFLIGFAALVAANSAGAIPSAAQEALQDASRICLALAIAALGIRTSLRSLAALGWQPFAMLVAETVWIALFVLGMLWFAR